MIDWFHGYAHGRDAAIAYIIQVSWVYQTHMWNQVAMQMKKNTICEIVQDEGMDSEKEPSTQGVTAEDASPHVEDHPGFPSVKTALQKHQMEIRVRPKRSHETTAYQ